MTGWEGPAGHLARGVIHEWYGLAGPADSLEEDEETSVTAAGSRGRNKVSRWTPPLLIFAHLARLALNDPADPEVSHSGGGGFSSGGSSSGGWVLWIGRRIWPYAHPLINSAGTGHDGAADGDRGVRVRPHRSPGTIAAARPIAHTFAGAPAGASVGPAARPDPLRLLRQSLFIDPPDPVIRTWAIDLALRSPAVAAVIADGRRLSLRETRRLQLAAREGHALALIARPPWELNQLTAAATRWRIRRARPPDPSAGGNARPRWTVELVRCKGLQRPTAEEAGRRSSLEWDGATGRLRSSAAVADRTDHENEKKKAAATPWPGPGLETGLGLGPGARRTG